MLLFIKLVQVHFSVLAHSVALCQYVILFFSLFCMSKEDFNLKVRIFPLGPCLICSDSCHIR